MANATHDETKKFLAHHHSATQPEGAREATLAIENIYRESDDNLAAAEEPNNLSPASDDDLVVTVPSVSKALRHSDGRWNKKALYQLLLFIVLFYSGNSAMFFGMNFWLSSFTEGNNTFASMIYPAIAWAVMGAGSVVVVWVLQSPPSSSSSSLSLLHDEEEGDSDEEKKEENNHEGQEENEAPAEEYEAHDDVVGGAEVLPRDGGGIDTRPTVRSSAAEAAGTYSPSSATNSLRLVHGSTVLRYFALEARPASFLCLLGLIDSLGGLTSVYGTSHVPVLLQSILLSSGPMWTFGLSKILLPNTLAPFNALFVLSSALLLSGVFLAVYPQVQEQSSSGGSYNSSNHTTLPNSTVVPGGGEGPPVVGYNGWWIGLYLLSTGLPNVGCVLQGWFLQRYSMVSRIAATKNEGTTTTTVTSSEAVANGLVDSDLQERDRDRVDEQQDTTVQQQQQQHHPSQRRLGCCVGWSFPLGVAELYHPPPPQHHHHTNTNNGKEKVVEVVVAVGSDPKKDLNQTTEIEGDGPTIRSINNKFERTPLRSAGAPPPLRPDETSPLTSQTMPTSSAAAGGLFRIDNNHSHSSPSLAVSATKNSNAVTCPHTKKKNPCSCCCGSPKDRRTGTILRVSPLLCKYIAVAGDTITQVFFTCAYFPLDAAPEFGASRTLAGSWTGFVDATHNIFNADPTDWNKYYCLMYIVGFWLSKVTSTYLNFYSPTIGAVCGLLTQPVNTFLLLLFPSWNVFGAPASLPYAAGCFVLLLLSMIGFIVWLERGRNARDVGSRHHVG